MTTRWSDMTPDDYQEAVLNALEKIDFPRDTHFVAFIGVPFHVVAKFISLMARASWLINQSPTECATIIKTEFRRQTHRAVEKILDNALEEILNNPNVKFPSE